MLDRSYCRHWGWIKLITIQVLVLPVISSARQVFGPFHLSKFQARMKYKFTVTSFIVIISESIGTPTPTRLGYITVTVICVVFPYILLYIGFIIS